MQGMRQSRVGKGIGRVLVDGLLEVSHRFCHAIVAELVPIIETF